MRTSFLLEFIRGYKNQEENRGFFMEIASFLKFYVLTIRMGHEWVTYSPAHIVTTRGTHPTLSMIDPYPPTWVVTMLLGGYQQ